MLKKYNNVFYLFLYSKYLFDIIPQYIKYIKIINNEICLYSTSNNLVPLVFFLKNHLNCHFHQVIDICGVDYPGKNKRFTVIYNLLSIHFNSRLRIKISVGSEEIVPSISSFFNSSLWLEREVWDMYGIFFSNHKDLRRILTDYGFEGYPLRKDFPQIGFVEIRYDDQQKHVLYEPVELAQAFRLFNFSSPWSQIK